MAKIGILLEKGIPLDLLIIKICKGWAVWKSFGQSGIVFDRTVWAVDPLRRVNDPYNSCSGIIDGLRIIFILKVFKLY